jgi:3-methyladenine DNA glycosylase/8-oxoguanine DNA glycosylase
MPASPQAAANPPGTPRASGSEGEILIVEVRPAWPFRLPRHGGVDGVLRHSDGALERLLHHGDEPVVVRVAQPERERVVFEAWSGTRAAAEYGIARMRFATGVDDDLAPFHARFRGDALIGGSLRRRPWLRVRRRPEPWEALAWAVCEQLIEFERAAAIQRRLVDRFGRRHGPPGRPVLRDVPTPEALSAVSPALLQSLDLGGARARTLVRAAREIARGRIDLHSPDHERTWRRLRAIDGIGPWTVEILALSGQGRHDQLPAGDLSLLKLVGRRLSGRAGGGGRHAGPRAREEDVREFFAPYGEWAGLAAVHMM